MRIFPFTFLIILLTSNLCNKCFGQERFREIDHVKYIASYLYDHQLDSANSANRKVVDMQLYIGEKLSKFANHVRFVSDSTGYYEDEKTNPNQPKIIHAKNTTTYFTGYTIIKDQHTNNTDTYEYIYNFHKITEDIQFNWNLIANSDTTILNYPCKKATTHFGGRNFSAWYTLNIPINNGPYKFKGLPGLIVKIQDNLNQHIFTLNSFKPINYSKPMLLLNRKYDTITYPQYIKLKKNKQQDLSKMVYNMDLGPDKNPYEIEMRNKRKNNFIEKY